MKTLLAMLMGIVIAIPLFGNKPASPTLFNLIQRNEIVKVELEYSFDEMDKSISSNEKTTALFRFQRSNKQWMELSAKVKARGKYRRRICDYPPIKIDFSKKQLQAMGLLPYDDLKLVTHCFDGYDAKDAVLREYLAYQLYAALTNINFRAQLVEITYKDTESRQSYRSYGILLEDIDEVAHRTGSQECEDCFGLTPQSFDQQNFHLHALFQYMIGNADWSLKMNKNVKVMQPVNGKQYWIVPYDFDFSGLVDANYAVPTEDYGQSSVKERVFLGADVSTEVHKSVSDIYLQKKKAIFSIVASFKELNRDSKMEIVEYLKSFYAALEANEI